MPRLEPPTRVFISYSHKDSRWLEKLKTMLRPLESRMVLDIWDDTKIVPGDKWIEAIENALSQADVAVLLVSDNFLASDFITTYELPRLLDNAFTRGLRIKCVLVSHCLWNKTQLAKYQFANEPSKPLDGLKATALKACLMRIAEEMPAVKRGNPISIPNREISEELPRAKPILIPGHATMPNKDNRSTRRDFLARGTGLAATTAFLTAAEARAAWKAASKASARVLGANDRINIAFIGNGMQFQTLIRVFKNRKQEKNDVHFAGVCDVWEPRLKYAMDGLHLGEGGQTECNWEQEKTCKCTNHMRPPEQHCHKHTTAGRPCRRVRKKVFFAKPREIM